MRESIYGGIRSHAVPEPGAVSRRVILSPPTRRQGPGGLPMRGRVRGRAACARGSNVDGRPSIPWTPVVGADQHVLPGVQIILKAVEIPALSGPSIIRHGPLRPPALAVSSVEQDMDVLHILELQDERAP